MPSRASLIRQLTEVIQAGEALRGRETVSPQDEELWSFRSRRVVARAFGEKSEHLREIERKRAEGQAMPEVPGRNRLLVDGALGFLRLFLEEVQARTEGEGQPAAPQPVQAEWDVFLAYATPDSQVALALRDELLRLDPRCRVFLDRKTLEAGLFGPQLAEAQRRSRFTVALISRSTSRAHFQMEEIFGAIGLSREAPGRHQLIPVVIDDMSAAELHGIYGIRAFMKRYLRDGSLSELARGILRDVGRDASAEPTAPGLDAEAPTEVGPETAPPGGSAPDGRGAAPLELLPDLLRGLDDSEPTVVEAVLQVLGRLKPSQAGALKRIARLLESKQHAETATRMLVISGVTAAPLLCEALADPARREWAERGLIGIGLPATAHLLEALFKAQEPVLSSLQRVLTTLGPEVIAPLLQELVGREEAVWRTGSATLEAFGERAGPALLDAAMEGEAATRQVALRVLASWPGLEELLSCESLLALIRAAGPELYPAFARAIVWQGNPRLDAVQAFLVALADGDEEVRLRARDLLVSLGAAALPELRDYLRTKNLRVLRGVLKVLRELGIVARPARPEVLEVFRQLEGSAARAEQEVATRAAVTLVVMDDAEALPPAVMARALSSSDAGLRSQVLRKLVPEGEAVLHALLRCLRDEDAGNREQAAQLLEQAGAQALPVVQRMLASAEPETASVLMAFLPRLGPVATVAMPEVLDSLACCFRRTPESGRVAGSGTDPRLDALLASIRPLLKARGKQCLPRILPRLGDSRPEQRRAALWALLQTDRAAELVPELLHWLRDPDRARYAFEAFDLMGELGVAALRRAKVEGDATVRGLAEECLDRLGVSLRARREKAGRFAVRMAVLGLSALAGLVLFPMGMFRLVRADGVMVPLSWVLNCGVAALVASLVGMGPGEVMVPAGLLLGVVVVGGVFEARDMFEHDPRNFRMLRLERALLASSSSLIASTALWVVLALMAPAASVGLGSLLLFGAIVGAGLFIFLRSLP